MLNRALNTLSSNGDPSFFAKSFDERHLIDDEMNVNRFLTITLPTKKTGLLPPVIGLYYKCSHWFFLKESGFHLGSRVDSNCRFLRRVNWKFLSSVRAAHFSFPEFRGRTARFAPEDFGEVVGIAEACVIGYISYAEGEITQQQPFGVVKPY